MKADVASIFVTFFLLGSYVFVAEGLQCTNCVELRRVRPNSSDSSGCIDYNAFVAQTHQHFNGLTYQSERENPVVCAKYTFEVKRGPVTQTAIIRLGLAHSDIATDRSNLTEHGTGVEVTKNETLVMTCVSASNVDVGGSSLASWVESCECGTDFCNGGGEYEIFDSNVTVPDFSINSAHSQHGRQKIFLVFGTTLLFSLCLSYMVDPCIV